MSLRIAIFEENENLRENIRHLLHKEENFEVVGVFSHAFNCIDDLISCRADVVLMAIELPGMSGIEAVRMIKAELPHIQVLIQTSLEDDDSVFDAIGSGASGYILKRHLNTKLIESITELQYGGSPMSPSIARKLLNRLQQIPQYVTAGNFYDHRLTRREKEVLSCLVEGLSYKMIAGKLFISYETVRSHVKNIYEKLRVASLTEVVAKAINEKIV